MSESDLLPRRDELHVEEKKVVDYLLNPNSPDGKSKARFFALRGFRREGWRVLADTLREHGVSRLISKALTSRYGQKFTLVCEITTPDARNPCIETVWIVEGSEPPRLVTAFPHKGK